MFFCGFAAAVSMITIVPVPGKKDPYIASCQPWFPIIGGILGFFLVLIGWLIFWGCEGWSEAAAFAVLAMGAILTGSLHLDGLADWADGFWGGRTPEQRLSIMKDSCVGAFGVVVLVIVLLGKWLGLTRIIAHGGWNWIVMAYILSRTMQVVLACAQPYARSEGGTGYAFIAGTNGRRTVVAVLVAIILVLLTTKMSAGLLVVVAGALLFTIVFGIWCRRCVGGVTGDLLGACSEIIELWVLLCGGVVAS